MTRISIVELASRTCEILDQVQQGEPIIVESSGNEPVVLLNGLDFRLLQALVAYVADREDAAVEAKALRDYLNEKISLGKVAELFQVNRFVLMDSFRRLEIPLRLGPASLEEALKEIAAARELLGPSASE